MLFEKYDTFIGVVIECKGIRYWVNCGNEMFKVVCKANLAKGEKVLSTSEMGTLIREQL